MSKFELVPFATLLATLLVGSEPALAYASPEANITPDTQLEEIVITARKQSESILSVPVAASTLSADDLARTGTVDISSLNAQIPSVNFDNSAAGGGSLTIRGIGSSVIDVGNEQSVAILLDGVQTSHGIFINLGLLDLAQVEVLKGPQALFFGKNSPAGVLSLTSHAPTDKLDGYIKGGNEFEAKERSLEGAISGPLTETLRARVAVRYSNLGGWLKDVAVATPNPFAGIPGNSPTIGPAPYDRNSATNLSGRVTLDYKPTSDFIATLRAFGARVRDEGPNQTAEVSNCGGATHPDLFGIPDAAGDCIINNRVTIGPTPPQLLASNSLYESSPYGRLDSYLTSLTMDYTAGPVQFTSATGYLSFNWDFQQNYPTTYAYPFAAYTQSFNQFSQEVRAVSHFESPINFSGGLYYESSRFAVVAPNTILPGLADPTTGKFESYDYQGKTASKSYSVFGQARWKFIEQMELDAGARYSRDQRENTLFDSFVNPNFPLRIQPVGSILNGTKTFNNFSPEISLNWTPVRDTLVYGSYRTGYKAGAPTSPGLLTSGFNRARDLFYQPEKIRGFEIGVKTLRLENRLRITAAAYGYQYKDLQISNFDAVHIAVEPLAGDLKSKGFELSAALKALPELTLNAGLGFVHSRYTRFNGVACYSGQTVATGCIGGTEDLTGQAKFRAPDWTGEFGFVYETHALGRFVFGIDGSFNFSTKYFAQENNSPFAVQGGYQMYNAALRVRTDDDHWEVALIGRNLGDKRIIASSYDLPDAAQPGSIIGTVTRPRQVTLQLTARY